MKSKILILLLPSLFGVGTAFSTEELAIEVAQPIVTENGIYISDVTIVRYVGSQSWGDVVIYTCIASYVANDSGNPENRNAANLAGLTAGAYSYHMQEQALFGDTVKVFVDLTNMNPAKVACCPDSLVDATLECVLINATRSMTAWEQESQSYVTAKHLTVELRGSADSSYSTRTYLFEDLLQSVPQKRHYECGEW